MKKIVYLYLLLLLVVSSCKKSESSLIHEGTAELNAKSQNGILSRQVAVCHSLGNGKFNQLLVNLNSVEAHLNHGDYLPDADGDGFTGPQACSGSMNDCDDSDATVFPGAPEICGDGKDNNCDGTVNEDCGPDFSIFYIRNSNATANNISAPWDSDVVLSENASGDGFTFGTPRGGQKVGYGTKFFDGQKVNTIQTVNWTQVMGNPGIVPYLNIWVTDGAGNYAVIASENSYQGTDFGSRKEWKIFEYGPATNFDWLFDGGTGGRDLSQYLTLNGNRIALSQLSDRIVIDDPGIYPSPYIGTGAPRGGFGFNLIWGDTQSNFTQKNGRIASLSIKPAGTTYSAANP